MKTLHRRRIEGLPFFSEYNVGGTKKSLKSNHPIIVYRVLITRENSSPTIPLSSDKNWAWRHQRHWLCNYVLLETIAFQANVSFRISVTLYVPRKLKLFSSADKMQWKTIISSRNNKAGTWEWTIRNWTTCIRDNQFPHNFTMKLYLTNPIIVKFTMDCQRSG